MLPQQATENSIDIGTPPGRSYISHRFRGKSNRMISNLKEDIEKLLAHKLKT